ncbi:MAG: 2-amino-4-hydroxy-6-hydroxymethyldihydropteridine diphosphokinase [Lachnospiraceae bacterium]|nr:2-amino-4-hydroxy-6-hydroxymethyldihydropteridine diphosphokinase [Lachnospiraceae bacterium]
MDEIRIEDLKVFARHGVFPEENEKGQNFYINASLEISLRKAGMTDALDDSVSYAEVCGIISEEMQKHTFKLIEAAAEHLICVLMKRFESIRAISLEIRKPEAPIDLEFASVSVCLRRIRHKAYIAIGSNEEYAEKNECSEELVEDAIRMLDQDPECRVLARSSMIKTKPYGGVATKQFINGAFVLETLYEPEALLEKLHDIENACGRIREERWGDRTLDLDIIYFDNAIIDLPDLTVPHRDMANRDFVLAPLCEIAPDFIHPVFHKTNRELLEEVKEKCIII